MLTETVRPPACPVCGATEHVLFAEARDTEYCTSDEAYPYLRCTACESVFLPDPPVDRLHKIYPPNYYSYSNEGQHRFLEGVKRRLDGRLFRSLLRRVPGDRLRVLDVGGGWGWLLSAVREVSPRVAETHEVEIDEGARARAEASGHIFHCTRVERFETDLHFDLILMLNLIEHVEDPAGVLSVMARLLAPGGLILIKTPNTDTLDCRLFRHRNWGGFHCPRHFVLFTMSGLEALARRVGLAVATATYTQGGPQWAASVLGWLAMRGFISITADRPMYRHPLYGPTMAVGAGFDFLRRPFARTAQMFVTLQRAERGAGGGER